LGNLDDFNPVITPVLDLTSLQRDAKTISGMLPTSSLTPSLSYEQASIIATTRTKTEEEQAAGQTTSSEVKFEQNIYAPTQLSTADIYRQTRNQITVAKEELSIP
jgi:hypothetical protein